METDTAPPSVAERDFPLGVPGFTYQDLHREDRLRDLDALFLAEIEREDGPLAQRLRAYRQEPAAWDALSRSRLLVDAARHLSLFVVRLFGVEREWRAQGADAAPEAVLFRFRRDFLVRRAARAPLPEGFLTADPAPLEKTLRMIERDLHPELPWQEDPELATSQMVVSLLDLESEFQAAIRQKKIPEVSAVSRQRAAELLLR
ncbi:MAG: hypothetical protein H7X85_05485, partial [Thermoanaerobaculia bacterium]|nr:hypothetical protein [Thermoanaerobaculia bacterium]